MHPDELASIINRWEPRYRPGGMYLCRESCTFPHGDAVRDLGALVAEVRRLQALIPPPGSIVVTHPCERCLHDRVTHLDSGAQVCESPCDCPGFVPRGGEHAHG